MTTHCSVLAWRIPGTAEPGVLLSVCSHRLVHDLAATTANNWLATTSLISLGTKTHQEKRIHGGEMKISS